MHHGVTPKMQQSKSIQQSCNHNTNKSIFNLAQYLPPFAISFKIFFSRPMSVPMLYNLARANYQRTNWKSNRFPKHLRGSPVILHLSIISVIWRHLPLFNLRWLKSSFTQVFISGDYLLLKIICKNLQGSHAIIVAFSIFTFLNSHQYLAPFANSS